MSSQDFRHASPSASAKDAEMQLLAFPSFPSLPLRLQDCPLHVNSLPSICTSGFLVFWERQRPQLSKSSGYGVFRYAPEGFRNGLRRSPFSHLPNAYGDTYVLYFFFFCTNSKVFLYMWAGAWKLGRSPRWSTGTPHGAHSRSISRGRRAFVISLPLLVEGKWSIWSLGLKIKVS